MILICQCQNARLIPDTAVRQASELLKDDAQPVVWVDDLCAMAAKQDPRLAQWAAAGELVVYACYERAVRSIFAHAGAALPASAAVFNLRTDEPEVTPAAGTGTPAPSTTVEATDPAWYPWFPVIDYQRCKNCKQCLNFCLFGVYAMGPDNTVKVARPHKCKTGCPACARVCPYAAIIFPKYEKSPINGDVVVESEWKKSHAESAASLKNRLSGNIYQLLRDRNSQSATSTSLSGLQKLKEQLDIPEAVFEENLPNAGTTRKKT
jgi:NAD-dependent dihydropyrimidine dehydrogenase PreA subunit